MNVSLGNEAQEPVAFFKLPGDSDEQTSLEFVGLENVSSFLQLQNLMYLGIKFCSPALDIGQAMFQTY